MEATLTAPCPLLQIEVEEGHQRAPTMGPRAQFADPFDESPRTEQPSPSQNVVSQSDPTSTDLRSEGGAVEVEVRECRRSGERRPSTRTKRGSERALDGEPNPSTDAVDPELDRLRPARAEQRSHRLLTDQPQYLAARDDAELCFGELSERDGEPHPGSLA